MFKSRFLRFLTDEVTATIRGHFGFIWIGSALLALCVFGVTLAWAVGRFGWLLGLPLALVAGFMSGGVAFHGVMMCSALLLDELSRHPGLLLPPSESSPPGVGPDEARPGDVADSGSDRRDGEGLG